MSASDRRLVMALTLVFAFLVVTAFVMLMLADGTLPAMCFFAAELIAAYGMHSLNALVSESRKQVDKR